MSSVVPGLVAACKLDIEGVRASFSFKEISRWAISCSRSLSTSCRRVISFSRLAADHSFGETLRVGREIERVGRCGDCAGLLIPWLEKEALRERAEDNSCDSETGWKSDL